MVKILLSLVLALFPILTFASDTQDRFYTIRSFEKGLNNQISDQLTPDNQANDLLNVRINDVYGSLTKRQKQTYSHDAGSTTVNSLRRYYNTDGVIKTILSTSTYLDVCDTTGTGTTHIGQGYTDGKRWDFLTFKDVAIGGNGYDRPIKYDGSTLATDDTDGHRTAGDLVTELGAPFAELNTGANLTAERWYQYKVMYLVNGVSYYSNARSNPLLTGATVQDIYLTDIPIGPTGTTERYVYRTAGNTSRTNVLADTTYHLVGTISDNTTTVLADTVTDAAWAGTTAWSTSGKYDCSPPIAQYFTIHKERLFASGNTTYASDLYFSDDGNPDFFDPDSFVQVRPDDGDAITFMDTFLGILIIGKTNSIQKFYADGDSVSDWYISDSFSFIGCMAPYSVAVSPIGIIYLGKDGIYQFNGQYSRLISDSVTKSIRDISYGNIYNCCGIFTNNEYYLSYTSKEGGTSENNRVLIYNFTRDAYCLDSKNVNSWAVFGSSTDTGTLYSGSSLTDGYIQVNNNEQPALNIIFKEDLDDGTFDDTRTLGTNVSPTIEIAWDCDIDGWLAELQTKDASISTIDDIETYIPNATIDRPDTNGIWYSDYYYINASALDRLFWNESLGTYGDVTFQVRLAAIEASLSTATWETAVSDPNGSDISSISGNYWVQLRSNLSTTDISETPTLYKANGYFIRMTYSVGGSLSEGDFSSFYKSGWKNFGIDGYKKLIKSIKVFYKGETGTLNLGVVGDDGDIDITIPIDMSIAPDDSTTDEYTGIGDTKIYTYFPPINSYSEPSLISQAFQFTIDEYGSDSWEVQKIEIRYNVEEYPYD